MSRIESKSPAAMNEVETKKKWRRRWWRNDFDTTLEKKKKEKREKTNRRKQIARFRIEIVITSTIVIMDHQMDRSFRSKVIIDLIIVRRHSRCRANESELNPRRTIERWEEGKKEEGGRRGGGKKGKKGKKKKKEARSRRGNSVVSCRLLDRVDWAAVGGRYAILNKFSWLGYCPPVNLTAWRPTSICDIVIAGVPAKPRMHCGCTAALRGLPSVYQSHLPAAIPDWQFPPFRIFSFFSSFFDRRQFFPWDDDSQGNVTRTFADRSIRSRDSRLDEIISSIPHFFFLFSSWSTVSSQDHDS